MLFEQCDFPADTLPAPALSLDTASQSFLIIGRTLKMLKMWSVTIHQPCHDLASLSLLEIETARLGDPAHSSRLESLYTLSLYDELSAAVLGGVGELRLMTLGNQSSSELPMGGMQNRDPPRPNRDEDPCLVSEDPPQLKEGLPHPYTVFLSSKTLETIISLTIPVGARRSLPSCHHYHQSWM